MAKITARRSLYIGDIYDVIENHLRVSPAVVLIQRAFEKHDEVTETLRYSESRDCKPAYAKKSAENLLEVLIRRVSRCVGINNNSKSRGTGTSSSYTGGRSSHANILPALVILETSDHFLVITENVKHNLKHCLMFS
ncbi:unnamed protein product, partial [Meganyctiphanes norvegica]